VAANIPEKEPEIITPILYYHDSFGLGAFGAPDNFEFHFLILLKNLKAFHLDGGKMHKNIRTIILGDETIPLGFVEPLNLACYPHEQNPRKLLYPLLQDRITG
jgi:hypothetical protein